MSDLVATKDALNPVNDSCQAGLEEVVQVALEENRLWVRTSGRDGKPLDPSTLPSFSSQNLSKADFRDAPLRGMNFTNACLRDADFRGADLRDADFTGAVGLLPGNVAGANLTGVTLPANIAKFDDLEALDAASNNSRTLFITMLGACLYSWLTIATTTDSALLINNISSPLPLISTVIPIVTFYYFTPPVLLCLHVYFLLNLQNVWNLLSRLPAIFPDSIPLERKSSPWLLTDLVSFYFRNLRVNVSSQAYIQRGLSVFLAWYLVPVTLLGFWFRYLPVRDLFGSTLQIATVLLSLFFSTSLQRLGIATLKMDTSLSSNKPNKRVNSRGVRTLRYSLLLGLACLLFIGTIGVIYGKWRPDREFLTMPLWKHHWSSAVPWFSARFGLSQFLKPNLAHLDISTKPPAWSGKDEELDSVKGANLSHREISFANCDEVFAVNARFVGANLSGSQFSYGDLRKGDFTRADGTEASFAHALLRKASFGAAKMAGARFYGAQLDQTVFTSDFLRARLQEYKTPRSLLNFSSADFSKTDFTYAKLRDCDCRSTIFTRSRFLVARIEDVDFTGSDLSMAYFTSATISRCHFDLAQLAGSSFDAATLTSVSFDDADFGADGKLVAVFTNATLHGVDFSHAKHVKSAVFSGAHFDDKTLWPAGFDTKAAGAIRDD